VKPHAMKARLQHMAGQGPVDVLRVRAGSDTCLRILFVRPDGFVESMIDVSDIRDALDIFPLYEKWCTWHAYPIVTGTEQRMRRHETQRMWDLCRCCSKWATDCKCHNVFHACKVGVRY
jgi:hypothetical protein